MQLTSLIVVLPRKRSLQNRSTQIPALRCPHWYQLRKVCNQKRPDNPHCQTVLSVLDIYPHIFLSHCRTYSIIQYIDLLAQTSYLPKHPPFSHSQEKNQEKGSFAGKIKKNEKKLSGFSAWRWARYSVLCWEMPLTIKNSDSRHWRKEFVWTSNLIKWRSYLDIGYFWAGTTIILSWGGKAYACLQKSTKNIYLSFLCARRRNQSSSKHHLEEKLTFWLY